MKVKAMVKKILIATGSVVLAAVLLLGRDAASYVKTLWGDTKSVVKESVPVEFELDRARTLLKDLVPEVEKNMRVIATEEVEVQRCEEQIGGIQARLLKDKEHLLRLKTDLAADKPVLQYAGRNYSPAEVKTDLAHRFERFKTSEATLKSLEGMRDARQKGLAAARQKLEGMLASRRQLQVEVENLAARNAMLAATQTMSNYQLDESQLGRVKQLVSDLRTRLEVSEKLVNAETQGMGEIPLEKTAPENISDQVGEYFGEKQPKEARTHRGFDPK